MKIIGIKSRDQVEDDIEKLIQQSKAEEKKNKDSMDSDEEDSDDEDLGFKRKRVIEKKKKKTNKDKMTEEK